MSSVYLNIGCGRHPLPGFVNIDIEPGADIQHDVTEGLPFEDASVDGVFSEHFFEHITQGQGLEFLRECRRVLKPGGVLRIAMPDLDELVRRYGDTDWRGDGEMFRVGYDWVDNRCEMLNIAMREWGHQWVYNEEELRRVAGLAGLRVRRRCEHGQSEDPRLQGLEYRTSSRLIMEFEREPAAIGADPLVSLLIPAYNPRFYAEALASALAQGYANLEIVICDDCPTDEIARVTAELSGPDPRVRYLRNEVRQGGMGNYLRCLEQARGELVKFLNDDDILAPDCVQRMVAAFSREPGVRLVTSRRTCIDEQGRALPDIDATRPLVESDALIEGRSLAAMVLALGLNPVGEPTTTMFRTADARAVRPHLMSFGGKEMRGVGDVALWLNLMSRGDVAYLVEPLSRFRLHSGQRQRAPEIHRAALESWEHLRFHGRRLGLFPEGSGASLRCRAFGERAWSERTLESVYPEVMGRPRPRRSGGELSAAQEQAYRRWVARHSLEVIDGELYAERMTLKWRTHPSMHLVVCLRRGEEPLLADTIDSLSVQLYPQWGLTVIADFPSPDPIFGQLPNLQWVELPAGASPVAAANLAIAEVGADWVALIPAGLRLAPQLLISCGDYINLRPNWRLIYTDSDTVDARGERSDPQFRPDFNLDLLRSMPYLGEFCLVRRDALMACGGYAELAGAENYDLALKVLDQAGEGAIGHIADVLYHLPAVLPPRFEAANGLAALRAHLARRGVQAEIEPGVLADSFRVSYRHASRPLVSIIIPTRDKVEYLEPCIESLLEKTAYPNYELIVVDNESEDPDTLAYFEELARREPQKVRVVPYPHAFNYAAISNMAAREARGEYLLFLNNDTQVLHGEWLERMLAHAQRPEVGVVGARLVFPETGRIQHAGVILGIDGVADHWLAGHVGLEEAGYMGRAQVDQDFSAVTAACMLVRRDLYEQVGGMDAETFCVLYNDVDLCLKIGEAGYKIVWTPHATLVHHGNASLVTTLSDYAKAAEAALRALRERESMLGKWLPRLAHDPAYNRNLTLIRNDATVETDVVVNWDVNFHDRPRVLGVPLAGGSGEYRVIQPLRALSRAGRAQTDVAQAPKIGQTRLLSVSEIARAAPDTLIFHAALSDGEHESIRVAREYSPALRVFTLDDLVTKIPEKSSAYKKIVGNYRDAKRRLRKSLSLCDRLLVTTQPLADLCADMIEDVRIIPNRLERALWEQHAPVRREHARPRVGWAGAQQHLGDLELIYELVRGTSREVDWVFFGMCPDPLRPYVREVHEFELGFENYVAKLATLDLDLAIAPLEVNAFNEAKSNLRLLEYGYFGWPVVCTDILPYQGAPVARVGNHADEWIAAVRARVHDLDAARREGEVLRAWVHRHWMLEDHLDTWHAALTRADQARPAAIRQASAG